MNLEALPFVFVSGQRADLSTATTPQATINPAFAQQGAEVERRIDFIAATIIDGSVAIDSDERGWICAVFRKHADLLDG